MHRPARTRDAPRRAHVVGPLRRSVAVLTGCVVGVGLVLGSCGGGDGDGDDAGDGDGDGAVAIDSVATPDGSFCSLLLAFRTSNEALEAELESGDRARAEAAITRLENQADLLRTKAPADIAPDTEVVAEYLEAFNALMSDNDYDLDAFSGNEAASAEFLALTTDEVEASLVGLRSFAETDCAPPVGPTTTTAPVPTAPAST